MPGKLRRINEYGHTHFLTISCYRRLQFFRHDAVKRVFMNAMHRTREKLGIRWVGYVIMPEHVHLLVLPALVDSDGFIPISIVLQDLKQYVGRIISNEGVVHRCSVPHPFLRKGWGTRAPSRTGGPS